MTATIITTHLGTHVPGYIRDCFYQIRLWNPSAETTHIYCILEPFHRGTPFWTALAEQFEVALIFTDTLDQTPHHRAFDAGFKGDLLFRDGYWRYVKERFYYVEELMLRDELRDVIALEYDVLVYTDLSALTAKFQSSHRTLRFAMDNDVKGHPATMYIPSYKQIGQFNQFLIKLLETDYEDMQSLALYRQHYSDRVHFLPLITEARCGQREVRRSAAGHTSVHPQYLSEDAAYFGVLFDSLVVGQWIGGVDPRNTGGHKTDKYENESALYSMHEMSLNWVRHPPLSGDGRALWMPILDGVPLCTIHCHNKALSCFLSDRQGYPLNDYVVDAVLEQCAPNMSSSISSVPASSLKRFGAYLQWIAFSKAHSLGLMRHLRAAERRSSQAVAQFRSGFGQLISSSWRRGGHD